MNPITGLVLFALIWWTVLFAVLPFGTKPVAEPDSVTGWRGAPARPMIGRKLLATTGISIALWLTCYAVIVSGWITFRSGWLALPED